MTALTRMSRIQLLVATAVVILVAELFANLVDVGDNDESAGSAGEWLALSAFGIALTAFFLLVLVPRIRPESRPAAALAYGVLALITVVVFWSALPFAFGAAAIACAAPADGAATGPRDGRTTAGAALGAVAIVVAFVFCVVG